MNIQLLVIGKTHSAELGTLITDYISRLKHYTKFECKVIPDIKNRKSLSEKEIKIKEGKLLCQQIEDKDVIFLLDESGKQYSSVQMSRLIEQQSIFGNKKIIFIIGGAYGFSEDVYRLYPSKISFSKMTFSHQMIRLLFVEQLYRAFTIIKGESYHHC